MESGMGHNDTPDPWASAKEWLYVSGAPFRPPVQSLAKSDEFFPVLQHTESQDGS